MRSAGRTLVVIATYNELENLPRLVEEIHRLCPEVDILVIDDNSPDGTGRWCERRAAEDARLRCLHRPGKLGLGSALAAGMRHAIENQYEYVVTLDADFSHPPRFVPELLARMQRPSWGDGDLATRDTPPDVVIGSRYVPGGAVEGWPLRRRLMSRVVNTYARWLLGLPVRDCSGGFRCYRVETLRRIDLDRLVGQGYGFLEEILWRLRRAGARLTETPIVFVDRRAGRSKISLAEAVSAVWLIFRLWLRGLLRRG
jgi:dolichol-phosphate mannosyltransferase